MSVSFIYRKPNSNAISKQVIFTGFTADGKPQGRTVNHKGIAIGVKELSASERRAFEARKPDQMVIEMGEHEPYVSIYDRPPFRSFAPPSRLGRGARRVVELTFAGDRRPPNFRHQGYSPWSHVLL